MQTSGVLVGVCFHVATGIRFCCEAVVGIVGFHHGSIVSVGLGYFKTAHGIERPGCYIPIGTLVLLDCEASCVQNRLRIVIKLTLSRLHNDEYFNGQRC